jgi:hypothetical protein
MKAVTYLCLLGSLMMVCPSTAQYSPYTLSGGIAAVTDKSTIDIALLSEVIQAKQEEVKYELIQRRLLKSLGGSGFALQNFVFTSFHTLLTYNDKQAIEKELLAHASSSISAG